MADPLSLLRQFYVNKREIVEKNDMICFGEYCWPKNIKTNYFIYSSSRDGPNRNYYTLECLLYFLKNIQLQHPAYVKQAASLDIPIVQRPDRRELLAYLSGETATSSSIDKSAPIELPISISQLNKDSSFNNLLGHSHHHHHNQHHHQNHHNHHSHLGKSTIDGDDGQTVSKLARLDEMEKVRKQFAARLDGPKFKKPSSASSLTSASATAAALGRDGGDGGGRNSTSLRDAMSHDQIAALKAKRLAKKRSTIIDADADLEENQATFGVSNTASVHSVLLQYDSDVTKEILNKERVWRNRSNILQSTGKNFQKTIFPVLATIKAREEGRSKNGQPVSALGGSNPLSQNPLRSSVNNPLSAINNSGSLNNGPNGGVVGGGGAAVGAGGAPGNNNNNTLQSQQYNRYDQERFSKSDAPIGFSIDTTSTYHGLTLKSVTDGGGGAAAQVKPNSNSTNSQNHSVNSGGGGGGGMMPPNKLQKRVPRTPIIIIPATNTSLITMSNARAILQDLKYIDTKSCTEQRRENEILIQRRKVDNTTVPYRIVDNPLKLSSDEWTRVVAVFVQGPAWQFKGWPWEGNPVEIFSRIKAFHLKFAEMKLDNNVAKWSVEIIELSRSKRHFDRANLLKFWSQLDKHIVKHKHNVVRY